MISFRSPFSRTFATSIRAGAAAWHRLRRDARGNVFMIMGFAMIPITFSTGMVIDYSRAARLQTKLNAVADAASLAGTTTPMLKKTIMAACDASRRSFISGASNLNGLTLDNLNVSDLKIVITETYASVSDVTQTCPNSLGSSGGSQVLPLSRVVTVTYNGKSANAFGGVLGRAAMDIGGASTARASLAPYIDIHLALDTSQSMGLASTRAGEITLYNATKAAGNKGCQFGCHVRASFDPVNSKSNSEIARTSGVEMRIDVLRKATQDMIQTAKDNQSDSKLYGFGLYQFGAVASAIATLSDDLSAIYTTAGTIDLGPNDASGYGDTNLPDILAKLSPADSNQDKMKITIHGDGTSRQKARAFVFIITDGVTDVKGPCTSSHCTAPIDPAQCSAFKANDVTVGIVYTTFLPIIDNPNKGLNSALQGDYKALVKTFSNARDAYGAKLTDSSIAPRLEACASPGWYFEGADGPTIHRAMQRLFEQASKPATITR